jgi:hypothetical protein
VVVTLTSILAAGFLGEIPQLDILEQSARNLYFHVPMWFTRPSTFGAATAFATSAPGRRPGWASFSVGSAS